MLRHLSLSSSSTSVLLPPLLLKLLSQGRDAGGPGGGYGFDASRDRRGGVLRQGGGRLPAGKKKTKEKDEKTLGFFHFGRGTFTRSIDRSVCQEVGSFPELVGNEQMKVEATLRKGSNNERLLPTCFLMTLGSPCDTASCAAAAVPYNSGCAGVAAGRVSLA